ncbi:MAG: mechanosensitive ion channel protein MscS [Coxiella sp. (in: Bacteria)]|nr:MAG: mechanosensitive ion channel protein MscS [Coxiella sp. (in: g-proteobacteria)]
MVTTHFKDVWGKFYNALYDQAVAVWPQVLTGVFIFLLFFLAAVLVRVIFTRLAKRAKHRKDIYRLLGKVSKVSVIIFGAVTALGTMGVDVTALITGLGLTGFAVGLALKDPISNAISGFMVLLYEPFIIGDTIKVGDTEAKVRDIQLRYTVLVTEGRYILIPNGALMTNTITVKNRDYIPPPKSDTEAGLSGEG